MENELMVIKAFNDFGQADTDDVISALKYASANGARIINASWETGSDSQALHDALAALDPRILVVTAAGNSSADDDDKPFFPTSYQLPNVVSVLSTSCGDGLSPTSSFGVKTVHLGAPGEEAPGVGLFTLLLHPPLPNEPGQDKPGTSFSAAHVTGAAALIAEKYPDTSTCTGVALASAIKKSVDKLPTLAGRCETGGRLNLQLAVTQSCP